MLASVRALLEHLIDYAGLFPPARLPLAEALQQYARHLAEPEAWMLGRFVCAAAGLDNLQAQGAPPGLAVAALGRGGRDFDEFAANLDGDLRSISAFRAASGGVSTIELPLPAGLTSELLTRHVTYLAPRLQAAGLSAFLELSLSPTWHTEVWQLSTMLASHFDTRTAEMPTLGLKLRCGGAAIPSVEQVASFIARCRELRLPWKATAGLHHPLRHRDPASQAMAHGFLNVFAAGVFAQVHGLDERQLAALLGEEAIAAFRFTDGALGWRDWACSVEQIRRARRWLLSFGSCSFDEPVTLLQRLGLLSQHTIDP